MNKDIKKEVEEKLQYIKDAGFELTDPETADMLSTLIQDEKEDSFINGFEVGYENGVYEYKRDLTDQPLTSSIWGKRIKDKWYKELWWSIIEFIRSRK